MADFAFGYLLLDMHEILHRFVLCSTCNSLQAFFQSLRMRPIRSVEATRRIKGVGPNFYDLPKESIAGSKGKNPFVLPNGNFSCIAAAALAALLKLEEAAAPVASANGTSFPMEDLIREINRLMDLRANAALNQSAEKYLNVDNLDPGWGQI